MTGSILVTGAGGFIGRSLVEALRSSNNQVRTTHHRAHPDADFVLDVGPATGWDAALDGIATVVHLAARVHVIREEASDPAAEFHRVNAAGTSRLATAAARAGAARFVFLSSAGVLGTSSSEPLTEDAPPQPANAYAASKLAAERALGAVAGDMEVVVLRPPLVYGPNAPGNFDRLGRIVRRGVPLPLRGATALRSFLYVENLVSAITTCAPPTGRPYAVYHVTDGEDLSTAALIERMGAAMDRRSRLIPMPEAAMRLVGRIVGRGEDVARLFAGFRLDDTAFRADFSWRPPATVDEGLRATFAAESPL